MYQLRLLWILLLVAPMMFGQSGLTGSCQNGGTYPNCVGGEVIFTGSGFSGQVHVKVTNAAGEVIDEADYTTSGGVLKVLENLSFADTYTVFLNGQAVLTITTT